MHVSGNPGAVFVREPRFSPRGDPGPGQVSRSHPGQAVSSSPLLPTPYRGPPRGSGAAPGVPGSPADEQQEAPSSGGEPSSPGTSPLGISDLMVADEERLAPGGLGPAPEGLTPAGRSRPALDQAARSAAAPEEGGEGSAARRGWQQDGAGGAGAEELRVAE